MHYRKLGDTDLVVSEIGFGTWGLGGDAYGIIEEVEALRLLRHAYEQGISFYDTADLYGQGRSEKLLGQFCKDFRKDVIIASKSGWITQPDGSSSQDFSARHIHDALTESLQRLQTDYIDLYLLHDPPADMRMLDETLRMLEEMQRNGHIRYLGISARTPLDGQTFLGYSGCSAIEANLNLIDQRAIVCGLMDSLEEHSAGLIARTPLAFGFLTGQFAADADFGDHDHRSKRSDDDKQRWASSVRFFEQLLEKTGNTPAQLALRYCLSFSQVTSVIPGMMRVKEIDEDVSVSGYAPLDQEDLDLIRRMYQEYEQQNY